MPDKNRQYRRIEKPLNLLFCVADSFSRKWDMSTIKNIGAGGIMFTAPSDLKLDDKVIRLQIKVPQLAPHFLELEALVLEAKPCYNNKVCEVRAKFINISEQNKAQLAVIEGMIDQQEKKNK